MPFFGENQLEEHEIKLLAYLIAEGHLDNRVVWFSNTDTALIEDFKISVDSFDKNLSVKSTKNSTYRITNKEKKGRVKNSLMEYLRSLGLYNKNSYTKFIPDSIFTATKANTALFLNRLFSCDGTIYYDKNKRSWRVSYASSSKRIITEFLNCSFSEK